MKNFLHTVVYIMKSMVYIGVLDLPPPSSQKRPGLPEFLHASSDQVFQLFLELHNKIK